MGQRASERRRAPRARLAMACRLRRRTGSAIACETVEVGPAGMSVCSARPLATDELLSFDLPPASGTPLTGQARVLRQQAHQVYVLRFEHLPEAVGAELEQLAARP
jgi:PilZ domain